MFDLEKKPKGRPPFEFGLEQEIKQDPNKGRELLTDVEKKIQEFKNIMRKGTESKDFEAYGLLLQAYAALHKVLTIVVNKQR